MNVRRVRIALALALRACSLIVAVFVVKLTADAVFGPAPDIRLGWQLPIALARLFGGILVGAAFLGLLVSPRQSLGMRLIVVLGSTLIMQMGYYVSLPAHRQTTLPPE